MIRLLRYYGSSSHMCLTDNHMYFPAFSHRFLGGRAARAAERLATNRLDGFGKLVARLVPESLFESGGERDRVYTPWVTFLAFLSQVLQ
jgi:hypothetical protein